MQLIRADSLGSMGKDLSREEIVEQLQAFGLLKNEVHVYFLLSKAGTSTAGVIARTLGTNRMGIYRTLKALEEKGLVESTVGRPSKFVALPVSDFLNRHIEEVKAKTSSLETRRERIVEYYEQMRKAEPEVEEPKFRIVQGRKHIFGQILKMLEKAKAEVCIMQTRNDLYRFINGGIDDKLKEIHDNKVEVVVLTQVDELAVEAVKNYMEFADVRHMSAPPTIGMVLVDETEALTTFAHDDSMSLTTEKVLAMWVRAPDYVKSMEVFFQTLWNSCSPARLRIATITTMKTLRKGLDSAKTILDTNGWTTSVPGRLIGESGVEHSFDLVARHRDKKGALIVVDLPSGQGSSQMLALDLKALDTKPAVKVLVTEKPPSEEESELAKRRGIRLIQAYNSRRLAVKIADEANRILDFQKGKAAKASVANR